MWPWANLGYLEPICLIPQLGWQTSFPSGGANGQKLTHSLTHSLAHSLTHLLPPSLSTCYLQFLREGWGPRSPLKGKLSITFCLPPDSHMSPFQEPTSRAWAHLFP